jgi:hypothetical protein
MFTGRSNDHPVIASHEYGRLRSHTLGHGEIVAEIIEHATQSGARRQ